MKDKIFRMGIVTGLAAVLLCGALRQDAYQAETSLKYHAGFFNGEITEILTAKPAEIGTGEAAALEAAKAEELAKNAEKLNAHFGSYRVTGFYPVWSKGGRQYFDVRPREADLLVGRIIDIQPERMVTYDMGNREFTNYLMKRFVLEPPQYIWENLGTGGIYKGPDLPDIREDLRDVEECYYEPLEGFITVSLPDISGNAKQWLYAFKDKDKLVMRSNMMSGGVFLLRRCGEEPEEPLPEWNRREIGELLSGVYGEYRVTKFLPTKSYPAWDAVTWDGEKAEGSVALLPEEEAGLMIGKTVTISEDLFVTYDNYRQPESRRQKDDFWVDKIEMENPDYRVRSVRADEIYGIRDGMPTGDLEQQAYVEISVYPGYGTNSERNLPQMYLTNDGRILLYAMGEYFLLEKTDGWKGEAYDNQENLSAWVGRYAGSSSIHLWIGFGLGGHPEDQPREYEIDIHENDSGGYCADIKIDSEKWEESVEIRADVCGNGEKISFVFKEYVSGELDFQEKQSDVLLSFRKDADTGDIYTYWGGLNMYTETPEEICFTKE